MPESEIYFINFLPGTGGNLIKQLLLRILHNKEEYITGKNGNAHSDDFLKLLNVKYDSSYYNIIWQRHKWNKQNINAQAYIFSSIVDKSNPGIVLDEIPPLWEGMFHKFPEGKNIIIQFEESDIKNILKNLYYKFNIFQWERFKNQNKKYFYQYDNHNLVPKEKIEEFITNSSIEITKNYRNYIIFPFHTMDTVPNEFSKKILKLNYKDIFNSPQKVLHEISEFSSRPIPNKLLEIYNLYLEQQPK